MEDNSNSEHSTKNSIYSAENVIFLKSDYEKKEKKSFLITKIISELLTDICGQNKTNNGTNLLLLKPFISKKIPSISIKDYIERLLKYSKTFNEIVIIVMIYLDTICAKHKLNLNYYNIHKFIFASFIVAIKFYEDDYYSINFYAKLGGIPKKEAISLEYEFLSLIDFKLFVKQELYDKYYNNLISLDDDDENDSDDDFNFM
jgi:hypothetical protein